jgi:hypothetical protein
MPERGPSGPVALSKALNCPGCGASLEMRAAGHSLTVICGHCGAMLDAKDPQFRVLEQFQARTKIVPKIPLGTRGKLDNATYEIIGFQVRTITVEGTNYSWSEYLLFNPFHGFTYLTEYNGHWNRVRPVHALPQQTTSSMRPAASLGGQTYRHFQTSSARTTYILGEFPWQVKAGDTVEVRDYIAPPKLLSAEITGGEITWSLGQYTPGKEIWQAFKLKGNPPAAEGIFADQPSPYEGKAGSIWKIWFLLMAGLLVVAILFGFTSANDKVFDHDYRFARGQGEPSFVTDTFELKGRPSNVEVAVRTDLANNWVYFNYALINDETGQAFDFGREVSYYQDSDGAEGSQVDDAVIPTVPAGRYYLRVEPEMPEGSGTVAYTLTIRRDVPQFAYYWIVAALLTIPPVILLWRSMLFEGKRWQESDYATSSSSSSSDDDDD